MRFFLLPLAALLALGPVQVSAQTPPQPPANAPSYSVDTIVNTVADVVDWFAPNTFVSIFGANLAFTTAILTSSETASGILPTVLPGTNVRVLINNLAAYVYNVAPTVVNVLIPALLSPGPATIQLEVNGIAGPPVAINLRDVAPALVTGDGTNLWAVHAGGTLITPDAPASPGEAVILFASGLGQTNPPPVSGQVPVFVSGITAASNFLVWINGLPLDQSQVSYAGNLPGAAGVYQINLTLPAALPHNPEIRISVGSSISAPGKFLSTQ